jgi:phosphoserine phosphatase RsbU/P
VASTGAGELLVSLLNLMEDRSRTTLTTRDLERSVTLYKGLLEVSGLINSITGMNELLAAILDVARRVMAAEASSLFLVDEQTGDLELTIARGKRPDPASLPIRIPRGKGIAGWVQQRRQSLLVEDAYDDPRFYPEMDRSTGFVTRSLIAVPLFQDAQDIGVLEVLNPVGKPAFDNLDLEAFQAYGNLAATSIQKLRLIKRESERQQWEKDLALATEIQHSFLPDVLPSTELLSLAALYRPAKEIVGVIFDVFESYP